ncbi:MAG: dienelactone hydrolase family protein [Mycobacteriales bacterium]
MRTVEVGQVGLPADLTVPEGAGGIVVFAHGSGSSRFSPRNRSVADHLNSAGLGTLLLDLLTAEEEDEDRWNASYRFNIPLLGERLVAAVDWAATAPGPSEGLPIGLFGASTGAAAALRAAADRPDRVAAVVSRGGRPDLAEQALPRVTAPVLLIVGEHDPQVLGLNRRAAAKLAGPHELAVVPGATHLFEEPGALDTVAALATSWLADHLSR